MTFWPKLLLLHLTAFVFVGSAYLIFVQSIDGVYFNTPITMHVDPQAIPTDKAMYERGDTIYLVTSYCRNRRYTADVTWRLLNATVITFPSTGTRVGKLGCFNNVKVAIGMVPFYAVNGPHHLEGEVAAKLNPLHTIYYSYRSVDFLVQ